MSDLDPKALEILHRYRRGEISLAEDALCALVAAYHASDDAVAAEREACAKIVDELFRCRECNRMFLESAPFDCDGRCHWVATTPAEIAAAIRARKPAMTSPTATAEIERLAWTKEAIAYVQQYGGRCRDCADTNGICDRGLPCGLKESNRAISFVLDAILYGMAHKYLSPAPILLAALRAAEAELEKVADWWEPHWRGAGIKPTADWLIKDIKAHVEASFERISAAEADLGRAVEQCLDQQKLLDEYKALHLAICAERDEARAAALQSTSAKEGES